MSLCWCAYTNLPFGFDKGTCAGFRVLVGTLTVNGVLAAWRRTIDFGRSHFTQAWGVGCTSAPCWRPGALTAAAESLFAEAQQHALAHAAVGRLVKVLHPPDVLAVPLRNLEVWGEDLKKEKANIQRSISAAKTTNCCEESPTCCHLQPQQDQQRHIVHPPLQPLFQSDRPTVVHIDGRHHVFEHLHKKKRIKEEDGGLSPDGDDLLEVQHS